MWTRTVHIYIYVIKYAAITADGSAPLQIFKSLNTQWPSQKHFFFLCMSFQICLVWISITQRGYKCVSTWPDRPSPLTRWCISWTAAWSHSSPSPCRWSPRGARWGCRRPPGLLYAAARPCGSRPPPRSPLHPQPGWCSAETAPTHMPHKCSFYNTEDIKAKYWQSKQTYKRLHINSEVIPYLCSLNI